MLEEVFGLHAFGNIHQNGKNRYMPPFPSRRGKRRMERFATFPFSCVELAVEPSSPIHHFFPGSLHPLDERKNGRKVYSRQKIAPGHLPKTTQVFTTGPAQGRIVNPVASTGGLVRKNPDNVDGIFLRSLPGKFPSYGVPVFSKDREIDTLVNPAKSHTQAGPSLRFRQMGPEKSDKVGALMTLPFHRKVNQKSPGLVQDGRTQESFAETYFGNSQKTQGKEGILRCFIKHVRVPSEGPGLLKDELRAS
jgi:hypothetical protein